MIRISRPLVLASLLGTALAAGACGGSDGPVGVLAPSDTVTLQDVQVQIFSPRCALSGCHVGASAPFGLDLGAGVAASNLIGVDSAEIPALMRIEPFDVDDSYLYMKLVGDPRILGDPMPLTGPPLGAGELALLESWIEQGAP